MKIAILSCAIWRPIVVIIFAFMVILQLIFFRQLYYLPIYTYQGPKGYYFQDDIESARFFHLQTVWLNASELEVIRTHLNENIMNAGNGLGLKMLLERSSVVSYSNGTIGDLRSLIDKQGVVGLKAIINELLLITANMADGGFPICESILGSNLVFNEINESTSFNTSQGGELNASSCQSLAKIALIIPFRDRYSHLHEFLPYMHSFMQKQQLHYRIYVIEQHDNSSFNRGKLMNVGYKEASRDHKYDCYVFHDVDLLPLNGRTGYNCSEKGPIHLAAAMDKFDFSMPYSGFFGGASAFTEKQLQQINGFPNKFVGWGGEDDDIELRVRLSGQETQRYPIQIARYHMIKHGADKGNEENPQRYRLLKETKNQWRNDGLNSLSYSVVNVTSNILFTKISVNVI